jgi:hypothetical protein
MRRAIFAVAILLVSRTSGAEQICLAHDGNFDKPDACVTLTSLKHVEVPASDQARRFLFTHDAKQDFIIGTQPAAKSAVDLHVGDGALQLMLEGAKVRGWPVETKFEIVDKSRQSWRWTLTAEQVSHAITIRMPDGSYTFTLTADGHEFLKKEVTISARMHAESLTLKPTLRIAAHVVSPQPDTVVSFPTIYADCSRKLCEGSVNGDIRCDVPRTATSICIEQPQYGRKLVLVDATRTDVDLGSVTLTLGGRIEVVVSPSLELPKGTTIALLRKRRTLETKPLDQRAAFEDVEPGEYHLLVSGPDPLQRKVITVKLAESADEKITIEITPYKLTGEVRYGDAALPNAKIELMERDWKSSLAADDHGKFAAQMWDAAEFATLVTGGVVTEPFGMMKRIDEADSNWTIRIPDRAIRGIIRDASSGAPVAGAVINIESVGSETHFARIAESDAHGLYAINGATDGDHTLTVKAEDFCVSDPVSVHLSESDDSRTVDFALVRGINIDLAVVDRAGGPLAEAMIVDDVTPDGMNSRRLLVTARDGRVRVPLAEGTQKIIYVLPASGSMAWAALAAPRGESRELRVVVPDGASILHVRALLDSGAPISGLEPRIRLNGQTIPTAVLRLYARRLGIALTTDANGEVTLPRIPAGLYELTLDKRGDDWTRVAVGEGETTIVQRLASN